MPRLAAGPLWRRVVRTVMAVCLVSAFAAGSLAAQRRMPADTTPPPVTTSAELPGLLVDQLPVDRVDDALLLLPGVNGDSTGLSLRGGDPADAAVYLDGIPISPGLRHINAAMSALTAAPMPAAGTNAVSAAGVITGPLAARFGNTSSGVVLLRTRGADSTWQPSAAYGTDNIGPNSLGFNRLQAQLGGPIGKLRVFMSGVLEGQKSAPSGFDADEAPLFVAAGIDTTVITDGQEVPIQNFAVYRGDCDQFSGSSNPDIADNFGADCHGARIPSSAVSSYQWLGRADYPIGGNGRLGFLALGTQHQQRLFDYENLYNNDQQFGERTATGVYGITWNQRFNRRRGGTVELNAYLSAQHERLNSGPLTPTGALDTRDPTGGFMISPLDFRWDFESFPINDELIHNVVLNNTAGRITPYDLRNINQYGLIDQFRNNAYGLYGFSERGGPIGGLELIHEHRWVGGGSLGWDSGRNHHITIGGQFTNYSLDYYSYELTSQVFGDAYRQRPIQRALWVEDRIVNGDMDLSLGLRYDYFNSHAARPEFENPDGRVTFFPRISSADGFNPANPSAALVFDRSQARLSPRIRLGYRASPRTNLRLGYAQEVSPPDFAVLYSGINTDLQTTNTSRVFGSDLQLERSSIWEGGLTYLVGNGAVLDIAAYDRFLDVATRSERVSLFDPVRNFPQDLHQYVSIEKAGSVKGIDVRIEQRISSLLTGMLAYSYQDAKADQPIDPDALFTGSPAHAPLPTSRPHTFSATLAYYPRTARTGPSSSGLLRGLGAYATYRIESGTVYCGGLSPACGSHVLSATEEVARLPTTRILDLRLTKSVNVGGRALTLYFDARNLLNTRNVVRLLGATGTVDNPGEENVVFRSDSTDFAREAIENNVYNTTTGAVDLRFGGAGRSGCADFIDTGGQSAAPDCLYLLQAEERWGNGDHIFSLDEQQRASQAYYLTTRGIQEFTGDPRRIRLGVQIGF